MMPMTRALWRSCSAGVLVMLVAFMMSSSFESSARVLRGSHPVTDAAAPVSPIEEAERHHALPAPPRARTRATPSPAAPVVADQSDIFRGLGAWVDLYDMRLDPDATAARMARAGVRTLYIQTGRSNTPYGVDPRVGRWLRAAHARDIKVVGWYLPFYRDIERDVKRTVAIANARFGSHRFDGLGIDIEYRGAVRGAYRWNRRMLAHATLVRRAVGSRFPLATIPPPPLQMRIAPGHWAGFPWKALAKQSDAIMLMSYWSDRRGCPAIKAFCSYEYTARNVSLTRALINDSRVLVHIIGGIGNSISGAELNEFINAAWDANADGASIYDVATTRASWWRALGRLQALGGRR